MSRKNILKGKIDRRFPRSRWMGIFTLVGLITLACYLIGTPQTEDVQSVALSLTSTTEGFDRDLEDMFLSATQTALALMPPAKPLPTMAVPPKASPGAPPKPPVVTSGELNESIQFKPHGTSAYFERSIQAGEQHVYTMKVLGGQTLILTATSENHDVFLDVRGIEDGSRLVQASNQQSYWFGTLPKAQTYQITLSTSNPGTVYFFSVEVPALITFQTVEKSLAIRGYVAVHPEWHPNLITRVRYLVHADAGETMKLELESADLDDLSMGIIGQQDGQPYLRYEVKNSGGEFIVPVTQGYYLDIYAVSGISTEFILNLNIE